MTSDGGRCEMSGCPTTTFCSGDARLSTRRRCGYDIDGRERELECEDFGASLLQHEIDHLDGILTLRRAEPAERYRAITELLMPDSTRISQAG